MLSITTSALPAGTPRPSLVGWRSRWSIPSNAYGKAWRDAREATLTPVQLRSPLARRPYDLRHAAVSLWLNAGVPATQAAEWAGHSVHLLMRVYAKCVYGQDEAARRRVAAALAATDAPVGKQQIKAA
jgi:integrase